MVSVYKTAHVEAARIVGQSPELYNLAQRVKRAVERNAAKDKFTGAFGRSIKLTHIIGPSGVRDYVVYSNDPGALSIEYGHLTIRRHKNSRRVSWSGVRVPGMYPFTNAYFGMKGTRS